ncbi:MAG: MoxR family ATPase, partial [Lentisphaerae bacterium]
CLMKDEIAKVIIGQQQIIEEIILTIFAGGHCLMTGVPGLGKTRMVKAIADIFDLKFRRIQFTPDLMPADIYGTDIMEEDPETGHHRFTFLPGPVFTNILLADEINRTPPKTQAALLEAMEEKQVTITGKTMSLDAPFFVLATQNPIELEGTYPLPEAQLDRFLLNVVMDYLTPDLEAEMVMRTTPAKVAQVQRIFSAGELCSIQKLIRQVPVASDIVRYAVSIVASSRPGPDAPQTVREFVKWGAGSRASQALILVSKARALLYGRYHVSLEDIRALAKPVLRHRIIPNFRADAENIDSNAIVDQLLAEIPPPAQA